MLNDIQLILTSWPKTAPRSSLARAVGVARLLEAHVACAVAEPRVPFPVAIRPYSRELENLLQGRQNEAHEIALAELDAFRQEAGKAGLSHEGVVLKAPDGGDVSEPIVDHARLRDLSIIPFVDDDPSWTDLVQALVFESGRPVLLLPDSDDTAFSLDRVVVAWDGGRAAARAVADALPLLRRAGEVVVVTVGKDKQMPETATALAGHLARKDIAVTLRHVERGNRTVGAAIEEAAADAGLLVMGAFGHSRIRDFFLGGATTHVLKKPQRPTLLSH